VAARWQGSRLYFLSGLSRSTEYIRVLAMLMHLELQEPKSVPSEDNPFGARVYKLRGSDLLNTGDLWVQATEEFDSDDEVLSTDRFPSLPLHATEHTALRGGKDNAYLAYHVPRERLQTKHEITDDYINELIDFLEDLPLAKKGDERRGIEDTRHYQFRVGCKQNEQAAREGRKRTGLLSPSADYIRDGEVQRPLYQVMECGRQGPWRSLQKGGQSFATV
jgi:hypothetical protein